jgi:hypothetical protein
VLSLVAEGTEDSCVRTTQSFTTRSRDVDGGIQAGRLHLTKVVQLTSLRPAADQFFALLSGAQRSTTGRQDEVCEAVLQDIPF